MANQSGHSRQILACPICGKKLRIPAGKRGMIVCPACRTSLLADTITGSLEPKDGSLFGEPNPPPGTVGQRETHSEDNEQTAKQTTTGSAEELRLGPSMPDITSGEPTAVWRAGAFLLLLVPKPRTIAQTMGYKGPSVMSYELTLAVVRAASQRPVMFISIERSSGDFLNLFAEELAKDEELAKEVGSAKLSAFASELGASGTLCLGVFGQPGVLHANLGSLEKVDESDFLHRAMDIFRRRFGFTGEIIRLDDDR
jgi:uncharacterized protein YbaR (Trm112 family)